MKFEKSRLYNHESAEKLKVGSRIIAADDLKLLKDVIEAYDESMPSFKLSEVLSKNVLCRFLIKVNGFNFPFRYAYLLENI